ncbi:hypothetical protein PLICRDRAFT_454617 [Plicaturopsis crispa FD-325 SS-3]|uniref:Uncharacterized protein n=1 Tax=Plicaturopsis crispa FD-325 SS-3 TaxID=944288 RepID=A0A0C9T5E2_PLICR|nr:hypothetical protein PLICRDRAFT_454617 [Plicaturopsis crispa FD-325 SS-3]
MTVSLEEPHRRQTCDRRPLSQLFAVTVRGEDGPSGTEHEARKDVPTPHQIIDFASRRLSSLLSRLIHRPCHSVLRPMASVRARYPESILVPPSVFRPRGAASHHPASSIDLRSTHQRMKGRFLDPWFRVRCCGESLRWWSWLSTPTYLALHMCPANLSLSQFLLAFAISLHPILPPPKLRAGTPSSYARTSPLGSARVRSCDKYLGLRWRLDWALLSQLGVMLTLTRVSSLICVPLGILWHALSPKSTPDWLSTEASEAFARRSNAAADAVRPCISSFVFSLARALNAELVRLSILIAKQFGLCDANLPSEDGRLPYPRSMVFVASRTDRSHATPYL